MDFPLIKIENLQINYCQKHKLKQPLVKGISFEISQGTVTGIIGESGSGKSISMKALLGLLPPELQESYDCYFFLGKQVSGKEQLPISMIFQDPMTSLNPLRKVEYHLIEVIERFQKLKGKQANKTAIEMLHQVGINNAEERMKQYPFELSGGLRQRIMIAMALLTQSKLLIADEPTTALDVTIQAQILALIKKIQIERDLTVILVSHDFGVIASLCDYVKVMYQGVIVEEGKVEEIFLKPCHPYTQQLLLSAQLGDKKDPFPKNKYRPKGTPLEEKIISQTHRVWIEV